MFGLLISDEAWLNATNGLLGIVAGIAVLATGSAIFHDVMISFRKRAQARKHFVFDEHALHLPELGLTMADGGERIDDERDSKS